MLLEERFSKNHCMVGLSVSPKNFLLHVKRSLERKFLFGGVPKMSSNLKFEIILHGIDCAYQYV